MPKMSEAVPPDFSLIQRWGIFAQVLKVTLTLPEGCVKVSEKFPLATIVIN